MSIVFSRVTGSAVWRGGRVRLAEDDPWDSEDQFVKEHPEHFADRPLRVYGAAGPQVRSEVEQASAAPGEKRTVRRPK